MLPIPNLSPIVFQIAKKLTMLISTIQMMGLANTVENFALSVILSMDVKSVKGMDLITLE